MKCMFCRQPLPDGDDIYHSCARRESEDPTITLTFPEAREPAVLCAHGRPNGDLCPHCVRYCE